MLPLWKQPIPIDWKNVKRFLGDQHENLDLDQNQTESKVEDADSTDRYFHICRDLERVVDKALQKHNQKVLLKKQKGRASVTEVTWVQEFSAPPKVGRQGEPQSEFHGVDNVHAKFLRQVRRLVNYVRISHRSDINDSIATHRDKLWQSIVDAKGFPPNFRQWWAQQTNPDWTSRVAVDST